jgi:hypothetical protein
MYAFNQETGKYESKSTDEIIMKALGKHPCIKPSEVSVELLRRPLSSEEFEAEVKEEDDTGDAA